MVLDNKDMYGIISKVNHWLSAITIISLYFLGLWMVDLDYYSTWYNDAPNLHKSIGILLALLTVFRLSWKYLTPFPLPNSSHSHLTIKLSKIAHHLLYLCLFIIFISGYLISTADGRAISVFNIISIPALSTPIENQAELAGVIHVYTTDFLILTVAVHSIAALKHHFIDKDNTLTRIIK